MEKLLANTNAFPLDNEELELTMDYKAVVGAFPTAVGSSFQGGHELTNQSGVHEGKYDKIFQSGDFDLRKCLSYRVVFPYQILVVDDNNVNQIYISELCRIWNIGIEVADDGFRALTMLKDRSFDMVITDVHMPDMDGYTLTNNIRALANSNSNIPVIALTADVLNCDAKTAINSGMDDYLAKPYRSHQLFSVFCNYFRFEKGNDVSVKQNISFHGGSKWIDYESLSDLYGDDYEHLLMMLGVFLKNTNLEINKLKDLYRSKEFSHMAEQAHKIKPTFAMVGLGDVFYDGLSLIEQASKSNPTNKHLSELFVNMDDKLNECSRDVRREYNWLKSSMNESSGVIFRNQIQK